MNRSSRRRSPGPVALITVAALVAAGLNASAASAAGPEQIVNGTFDNGHTPWWTTGNLLPIDTSAQQLCVNVPGGTVNPWDAIVGQDNIALISGESYAFTFSASGNPPAVAKALVQLPRDPFTAYFTQNQLLTVSGDTYTFGTAGRPVTCRSRRTPGTSPCRASPACATTPSTSPVGGTTRVTTASTSSTAASQRGS